MTLYAGLMSGTSMDGVDAVLLEISRTGCQVRGAAHQDYDPALTRRLRAAVADPQAVGLDELGQLDVLVAEAFVAATRSLLAQTATPASALRALGSHGQTLLHRPRGAQPFTLQIGDPNLIAEHTGIDVVADFRRRDLAAGGEAAPLMPAFHAAVLGAAGETRVVANIGGIANITVLGADGSVTGFDTGPGNCLMDLWIQQHGGAPFDADGALAARGQVEPALLARLLDEPYLAEPAPKSTGRELFNAQWLAARLGTATRDPADVQATLCEFTAATIAAGITELAAVAPSRVLVCGGGALNGELMRRLAARLPGASVASTASLGVAPLDVEGAGFAWLAHRHLQGLPGNLAAVTGARGPRVLGALYPGAVAKPL